MKFITKSLVILAIIVSSAITSFGQGDTTKTFSISGSVDAYLHSTFGMTNGPRDDAYYAPSSAFANQKGFAIGMANLIASYDGEKTGFVADLVFGPRGRDAVFNSSQGIVNQLFVYYKPSDAVTLNFGQFNTFVGYEVISPAVNFHYSTSYLFSYGPFSHTGIRADFDLGNGLEAKLAVMNPMDLLEFNPVNTYQIGAQIGKSSDAGGVWLNLLYGDGDGKLKKEDFAGFAETSAGALFQADLTLGYDLSDAFSIGFNTSYQTVAVGEAFTPGGDVEDLDGDASSFFGFAVYPKVTLSETFALGLRAEYFSVKNYHLGIFGLDDNGDGNVMEFTLSGNIKAGDLTFIPEFRIDMTSEDSFVNLDGEAKKMMPSFNLAAVYKF